MGVFTAAGSKMLMGTTAVNPIGDTYAEIGDITNLGQFGRMYSEIKYTNLGDRNVQKFKGERDDGNIVLELGRDVISDAGQQAVQAALDSDADYNFKVTLNDSSGVSGSGPTIFYMKAKVIGFQTTVGTPTNVVTLRITLAIKSGSINEIRGD